MFSYVVMFTMLKLFIRFQHYRPFLLRLAFLRLSKDCVEIFYKIGSQLLHSRQMQDSRRRVKTKLLQQDSDYDGNHLERLTMDSIHSSAVILLLGDPHLLERVEAGQNRTSESITTKNMNLSTDTGCSNKTLTA